MSRCERSLTTELRSLRGEDVLLKSEQSSQRAASSHTGIVCMDQINCKLLCPLPSCSTSTPSEFSWEENWQSVQASQYWR